MIPSLLISKVLLGVFYKYQSRHCGIYFHLGDIDEETARYLFEFGFIIAAHRMKAYHPPLSVLKWIFQVGKFWSFFFCKNVI
jgi:hypothetical protein